MDRDFENSIILGYGPTEKTHCEACAGNHTSKLKKGFAFHCYDPKKDETYVAGDTCRKKIDDAPLTSIAKFGASTPEIEETGRNNQKNGTSKQFRKATSADEKLISEMSAWVQLRQHKLPQQGFQKISFRGLEAHYSRIKNGTFSIQHARQVKRTYDSVIQKQPSWSLENLQKCHDVGMQITRILSNKSISQSNRTFITSIRDNWLLPKYFLTPKQLDGLNKVAKFRGEPEWTLHLKF